MALSLDKGSTVNLNKVAADLGSTLTKVTVGLGWKANSGRVRAVEKRRFFGGTKTVQQRTSGEEYDLDASVFVLGANGRVLSRDWFVYYGHKDSPSGIVHHFGDNLVGGSGNKDDEQISIQLDRMPPEAQRVVVVVNIYRAKEKDQSFGDVEKSYMRIFDDASVELARYNLTDQFGKETAVTFGELYRDGNDWQFTAVGKGHVASLSQLASQYGT